MHVSRMVAAALDPLLTNTVFAAGQTGLPPGDAETNGRSWEGRWPEQSGSVIWCAAYADVKARYPSLPQAQGQDDMAGYACVDLTVTIGSGRITTVDFEGLSLAETFAELGRQEEAEAAKRILGTPAQAATPVLTRLLGALLDRSEGEARTAPVAQ